MSVKWTQSYVNEQKAHLKAEVVAWRKEGGEERVLQGIMQAIDSLNLRTSSDCLKMYLLGVFGLIAHRNSGLLTDAQSRKLSSCCFTALRANKIDPEFSKLAYLYADIHALDGQIACKEGCYWGGIWQQLAAKRYLRETTPDSAEYHSLTLAQRYLRQGMLDESQKLLLNLLQAPKETQGSTNLWNPAVLCQLIILRLKNDINAADIFTNEVIADTRLSPESKIDCEWEAFCRVASKDGQTREMRKATKIGGRHFEACYIVEHSLWEMALGEFGQAIKPINLEKQRYNRKINFRQLGDFYEIACALQGCLDKEIPTGVRLEKIGSALIHARRVDSLDWELLIWLAAKNVLRRAQMNNFAAMCSFEYRSLSLRISQGISPDVLGIDG